MIIEELADGLATTENFLNTHVYSYSGYLVVEVSKLFD